MTHSGKEKLSIPGMKGFDIGIEALSHLWKNWIGKVKQDAPNQSPAEASPGGSPEL